MTGVYTLLAIRWPYTDWPGHASLLLTPYNNIILQKVWPLARTLQYYSLFKIVTVLASPADKSQTGRKATRTRPDHTRKNQSQQTQRDRRQAGRRRTDKRFVYGSTPDRKIGGWCGLPDNPRYNRRLLYDTTRDRSVASLTVYLGFELSEYRLEYGVSSIGSNATAGAGLLGYCTIGLLVGYSL